MDEMNEEEKKIIKGLEWSQQQMRLGNLPNYDKVHYADVQGALNYIDKLQKELEQERKNRKELFHEYCELKEIYEYYMNNYMNMRG